MKFGVIDARTLSRAMQGKHVAALSYYQTELCDVRLFDDNDRSAAR